MNSVEIGSDAKVHRLFDTGFQSGFVIETYSSVTMHAFELFYFHAEINCRIRVVAEAAKPFL